MLKGIVKFLGGDTHKRAMSSLFPHAARGTLFRLALIGKRIGN